MRFPRLKTTRVFAVLFLLWALLWLIGFPLAVAYAHEGWEWIMNNPRYVAPDGVIHCCGADCGTVDDKDVTESDAGFTYNGVTLDRHKSGVYWTEDGHTRVCKRADGSPRCIFIKQPGS